MALASKQTESEECQVIPPRPRQAPPLEQDGVVASDATKPKPKSCLRYKSMPLVRATDDSLAQIQSPQKCALKHKSCDFGMTGELHNTKPVKVVEEKKNEEIIDLQTALASLQDSNKKSRDLLTSIKFDTYAPAIGQTKRVSSTKTSDEKVHEDRVKLMVPASASRQVSDDTKEPASELASTVSLDDNEKGFSSQHFVRDMLEDKDLVEATSSPKSRALQQGANDISSPLSANPEVVTENQNEVIFRTELQTPTHAAMKETKDVDDSSEVLTTSGNDDGKLPQTATLPNTAIKEREHDGGSLEDLTSNIGNDDAKLQQTSARTKAAMNERKDADCTSDSITTSRDKEDAKPPKTVAKPKTAIKEQKDVDGASGNIIPTSGNEDAKLLQTKAAMKERKDVGGTLESITTRSDNEDVKLPQTSAQPKTAMKEQRNVGGASGNITPTRANEDAKLQQTETAIKELKDVGGTSESIATNSGRDDVKLQHTSAQPETAVKENKNVGGASEKVTMRDGNGDVKLPQTSAQLKTAMKEEKDVGGSSVSITATSSKEDAKLPQAFAQPKTAVKEKQDMGGTSESVTTTRGNKDAKLPQTSAQPKTAMKEKKDVGSTSVSITATSGKEDAKLLQASSQPKTAMKEKLDMVGTSESITTTSGNADAKLPKTSAQPKTAMKEKKDVGGASASITATSGNDEAKLQLTSARTKSAMKERKDMGGASESIATTSGNEDVKLPQTVAQPKTGMKERKDVSGASEHITATSGKGDAKVPLKSAQRKGALKERNTVGCSSENITTTSGNENVRLQLTSPQTKSAMKERNVMSGSSINFTTTSCDDDGKLQQTFAQTKSAMKERKYVGGSSVNITTTGGNEDAGLKQTSTQPKSAMKNGSSNQHTNSCVTLESSITTSTKTNESIMQTQSPRQTTTNKSALKNSNASAFSLTAEASTKADAIANSTSKRDDAIANVSSKKSAMKDTNRSGKPIMNEDEATSPPITPTGQPSKSIANELDIVDSGNSSDVHPLKEIMTAKKGKIDAERLRGALQSMTKDDAKRWLDEPLDSMLPSALFLAIAATLSDIVSILLDFGVNPQKTYEGKKMYQGWIKPGSTPAEAVMNRKGRFVGTMLGDRLEEIWKLLKLAESNKPGNGDANVSALATTKQTLDKQDKVTPKEKQRRKTIKLTSVYGTIEHTQGDPSEQYDMVSVLEGVFTPIRMGIHKKTGEKRAIKAEMKVDEELVWEEMAILRKVHHPNVIQLYETYEDAKHIFVVLEICSGGEMFKRLFREGGIAAGSASRLMHQCARSIEYIHSVNICHRDIQPENFLLKDNGPLLDAQIKLIDFSRAKEFGPETEMKTKICNVFFVAPEVLSRKEEPYTEKVDIWSLGVVFFLMFCGVQPFNGETELATLKKVKRGAFTFSPEDVWADVSDEAKNLIQAMLVVKPESRLSASSVVKHPWVNPAIKKRLSQEQATLVSAAQLCSLRNFSARDRLNKVVFSMQQQELPRDGMKALASAFRKLDKQNNGRVHISQVRDKIRRIAAISEHQEEVMRVLWNLGSDGIVSFDMFVNGMIERHRTLQKETCKAVFDVVDYNGVGTISPECLENAISHDDGNLRSSSSTLKMGLELVFGLPVDDVKSLLSENQPCRLSDFYDLMNRHENFETILTT